jgi:hypothetical protein
LSVVVELAHHVNEGTHHVKSLHENRRPSANAISVPLESVRTDGILMQKYPFSPLVKT